MLKRLCLFALIGLLLGFGLWLFPNEAFAISSSPAGAWGPPVPISQTEGSSYSPRMVRGPNGTIHMVWSDWVDLAVHQPYILYANKPPDGDWSSFTYIPGASGSRPQLAISQAGILFVAWDSSSDVMVSTRQLNGTWTTPESAGPLGSMNDLAVDSLGGAHVVYLGGTIPTTAAIYYTHKPAGGPWSAPELIFPRAGVGEVDQTHSGYIEVDPAGTVHVLIDHNNTNPETYYTFKPAVGVWSTPELIPFSPLVRSSTQFVSGISGILHLLWNEYDSEDAEGTIYHSYKNPGENWNKGTAVTRYQQSFIRALGIALDSNSAVCAAWSQYPATLGSACEIPSRGWASPSLVDMQAGLINLSEAIHLVPVHPGETYFAWDSGPTFIPPIIGEERGEIWVAKLSGVPPVTTLIDSTGGFLESADGNTHLDFPPGTVAEDTIITYTPAEWPGARGLHLFQPFELSAIKASDETPINSFLGPYTITITYEPPVPLTESTLGLYTWNSPGWIKIPTSSLDILGNLVSASLSTTGYFALGGDAHQIYLPLVRR